MPYTDTGLPFARDSHESYQAAVQASASRETKTRAYLRLLYRQGPLTDADVHAITTWPRSSICSIRNGAVRCGLVEKTGIVRVSEYGAKCRAWYLSSAGVAAVTAMTETR